jgi:hypothetical protein
MPYVESADARVALMTMYLSRYPLAGSHSQRFSSKRFSHSSSSGLRVKNTNLPPYHKPQDRFVKSLGKTAFMKDLKLYRSEDGKIFGIPIEESGDDDIRGSGRTVYETGITKTPRSAQRWKNHSQAETALGLSPVSSPLFVSLADIERRDTGQRRKRPGSGKLARRRGVRRIRKEDLRVIPPQRMDIECVQMPELSPVDSDDSTDSEMSWNDLLLSTTDESYMGSIMDDSIMDEMFNTFINVDECADWGHMWKDELVPF